MDSRDLLTAEHARAARALLNWSRVRLAAKANLSEMTISEFENGVRNPRSGAVAAMRGALEGAGIVFAVDGSPSLVRAEGQTGGREADNRNWRRRERKRARRALAKPVGA
ncbi:helix-turn-helix transcriptional regulator [Mesorhizobium sp. WSM4976]|uniref:helix-turn-helix domain-containing protein n=1 Tax=Mesorhizobium sp. WSM4976 TaxID=3038549 RepID=UPI0024159FC8|nr:helix-turn-helix transcriptional regulator [Mesorhizobium sp. WSM4976]MDG4897748.1 helix-turn-helix transcriptional regulator [Mesorhizobium sp. WSM4976]